MKNINNDSAAASASINEKIEQYRSEFDAMKPVPGALVPDHVRYDRIRRLKAMSREIFGIVLSPNASSSLTASDPAVIEAMNLANDCTRMSARLSRG